MTKENGTIHDNPERYKFLSPFYRERQVTGNEKYLANIPVRLYYDIDIDWTKSDTDPKDFRVPFTDGSTILKKIEDEFIVKEDSKYSFSNWFDRLKGKRKIKEFGMDDLENELRKLAPGQNYWIVMAGTNPTTKNLVYDGKPNVIFQLLCRREEDFYIVDKRYRWLAYFKDSPPHIEVFKSGDRKTPWDKI